MNTKKIVKQVLRETASLREELMEAALLEDSDIIKKIIDKIIKLCCEINVKWLFEYLNIKVEGEIEEEIDNIYFNKDGKTIYERLDRYYKNYIGTKNVNILLQSLDNLVFTEIVHCTSLFDRKIVSKCKEKYKKIDCIYQIDVDEGSCGDCVGWSGFFMDETGDFPPYHKNCGCGYEVNILYLDEAFEMNIDIEDIDFEE